MAVTFCQTAYSVFSLCSYRNRRRGLHLLAAQTTKSWKAAKQDYLHGGGTLSMHYPNMCPSGAAGVFNALCCALLVLSNTDRTAVLITNVSSCHVNRWPTAQFHCTEEEGFLGQNVGFSDSYTTPLVTMVTERLVKRAQNILGFLEIITVLARSLCVHPG